MSENKEKKGFSGLAGLASDISDANNTSSPEPSKPPPEPSSLSAPKPSRPHPTPSNPVPKHSQPAPKPTANNETERKTSVSSQPIEPVGSGKSDWGPEGWVLSFLGVVFVIWVIYNGEQYTKKTSYNPPPLAQTYNSPQSNSAPVTLPSNSQSMQYEKPPVGTNNVLSVPQIRWCVREGIRLETMRDIINSNDGINEFNRLVEDDNRRCRSYRYNRSSLEQAQREVEANRNQIVSEAVSDAGKLGRTNYSSSPMASAEKAAAEKAEAKRIAAEISATQKAEAERVAAERAATQKAEAERVAAEKAAVKTSPQENPSSYKGTSPKYGNNAKGSINNNYQNKINQPQLSVPVISPSSSVLPTGRHISVHGRQQLIETLMRILGVSYIQNVEISFSYAGVQIPLRTNRIDFGKRKPILVDFGSFYGDAAQALEKAGFIVIQILDADSVYKGASILLNALAVSYSMDIEIQIHGKPPLRIPGICIERKVPASLILTEAILNPEMIQAVQEKGFTIITVKRKTG